MADVEAMVKWGNILERSSWLLVFAAMMTQVSAEYAFPSYNVILGFWGAYCAFGKHGRATFGLLTFCFFGVLMDIVFCSINNGPTTTFQFALVMLIFCLFIKVYILFCGAHFFSSIGGAYTMEHSLYDNLPTSVSDRGYFPPSSTVQQDLASTHG